MLNQSGKAFNPQGAIDAHVTFEIVNTGTHPVKINTLFNIFNQRLENVVNADLQNDRVVEIGVGGRVTISGDITDINNAKIRAIALGGNSSVQVTSTGVLKAGVGYESSAVSVNAGPVNANLAYSYDAGLATKDVKVLDTDRNEKLDTIVLTFNKAVNGFEAGDFRIDGSSHRVATSVTKDDKKLIIKFDEDAIAAGTEINYDPNYAGGSVLVDEFGNKVQAFHISYK